MENVEEHDDIDLSAIFDGLDLGGDDDGDQDDGKSVAVKRTKERHFERRIKSELALE